MPTMSFAQTKDRNPTSVIGTVVRFTDGATTVDVTVGEDSPIVRDFLSMLPLTLKLEEFAGREKISYLPRKLKHIGSPGSDPEDGDLIYFVPWGNLGFYYKTAGIDYSDQTLHIGTYKASPATREAYGPAGYGRSSPIANWLTTAHTTRKNGSSRRRSARCAKPLLAGHQTGNCP